MDATILIATLINFAVLGLFTAAMLAHCLHSWTHSMRGFIGMFALSFFVIEFWMASATDPGSIVHPYLSIVLVIVIVVTIKFGFDAFVHPWYERAASHTKVRHVGTSRLVPHLSSK